LNIGRFISSSPSDEFVNKSIDVCNENVLYNWMDRAFMCISKVDKPFKAANGLHHATIQALIDVCSKTQSSVVDFSASIGICFSSKNSFIIFASNLFLTIFHLTSNIIKAYQSLEHHILALGLDMEVIMEVLEPLVEVAMHELNANHDHSFNIDIPIKKLSKRLLDYE
jgi:hypothetical protein